VLYLLLLCFAMKGRVNNKGSVNKQRFCEQ